MDAQSDFEIETDLQVQDAVASLQQMQELDPQTWQVLDAQGRLEALQNVENQMAGIQGRPPVEIISDEMGPKAYGGYDGECISINSAHLNGDMPVEEFLDTIIHEGRHAYQDYAVQNPGAITDSTLVNSWAENLAPGHYLTAEQYGQELYAAQPVEADAWSYASRIINTMIAGRLEK